MSETRDPYDSGAAPAPAATCPTLDDPALLEILADIEHERWSGWETYRREKAPFIHPSGDSYLHRWYRQETMPYAKLTEAEKESDRIEARKGLAAIKAYLAAHPTPDPLTALERAALEAAIEDYLHLLPSTQVKLSLAVERVIAARAAAGTGT